DDLVTGVQTCALPIFGFALENFDAVGKWRTSSDGAPIDPSASFPDGTRFEGVAGLRTLLVSHKEDFVRTLCGKLLAYAIGRGLEIGRASCRESVWVAV